MSLNGTCTGTGDQTCAASSGESLAPPLPYLSLSSDLVPLKPSLSIKPGGARVRQPKPRGASSCPSTRESTLSIRI